MNTAKRKRRTKLEVLEEYRELTNDVGSALNYITFQTIDEIKQFANSYRETSGEELLTTSQVKKGLTILDKQGIIRKRKDKYAYVNGK